MSAPSASQPLFDELSDAPKSSDLAAMEGLFVAFVNADYTVDGIEEFLGTEATAALSRDLFVPATAVLAAEAGGGALGALIECLMLGRPVAASRLPALEHLVSTGVVRLDEETATAWAMVDVRPYETDIDGGWWIASDLGGTQLAERAALGHGREQALRPDHVVGIGPATTLLTQMTPREKVGRALDLGVGMGVQTMHLLSHCDRIVATDISARALAFARFNLILNAYDLGLERENIEERVSLRQGSLFEPVEGEQFDLIVTNPPFVITPRRGGRANRAFRDEQLRADAVSAHARADSSASSGASSMREAAAEAAGQAPATTGAVPGIVRGSSGASGSAGIDRADAANRYTYRDAGFEGDRLMREVVSGFERALAPGGRAVMLGNWEVRQGDADGARVGSWTGESLDSWIVERERATPVEYADMWLKDASENAEIRSWRGRFLDYLRDFDERGVDEAAMGMLLFSKTAAVGSDADANGAPDGDERAAGAGDAVAVDAKPLRRYERIAHPLGQPLGPVVDQAWDALQWLRARPGEAVFDERLVVAADVTEERHARPGAEGPSVIQLRQGGGFRRTHRMSTELAGFVGVCDGELTGRQITAALAAILDADDAAIRAALVDDVRELILEGFLAPA